MNQIEVTAVIPVYNDRLALQEAIPRSILGLGAISPDFELIVAEDGSTDGSPELVKAYAQKDTRVHLLHSDERLGRGRALNNAFSVAQGSIVCYYDVDLATDMQHLPALIGAIREGYDIATGSRLMPDSDIVRTGERELASRSYNLLVRTILGSPLHDHQCGFKAFQRDRVRAIIPSVKAPHWFWDTEILVRAQHAGYKIKEIPVRWRQGMGTTVRVKDVVEMGTAILGLWWHLHVSKD